MGPGGGELIVIKTFRMKWRLLISVVSVVVILLCLYSLATKVILNRNVEAMSWALANKVVVIDPGHGGPDGGGKSQSGVLEKDITLEFSRKLALIFSKAGSAVIMTREGDYDLSKNGKTIAQKKKEDLENRVSLAKKNNADVYISIHTNCFGTKWTGAQTFYYPKSEDSKNLAESIQNEIIRIMGNTRRTHLPLEPYILRNLDMPAVIVEVGFLSNPREEKLLLDSQYQDKMAFAVYAGVVKHFAGENAENLSPAG